MFTAHHAERYATEAQLGMEERIIATASRRGPQVPRLAPAAAARLLGSDQAQLEAQLSRDVSADVTTETGSGLHLDQAAAAYRLLTSDRRAEVMIGPAGTGKTRTVAAMARAWRAANPGARVIGLTASQQAAQVLRRRGPCRLPQHRHVPDRPAAADHGAGRSADPRRGLDDQHAPLRHLAADGRGQGREGRHRGRPAPARRGHRRGRHDDAVAPARPRAARRADAVPRALGAGREPAAARRRRQRPDRVRPAGAPAVRDPRGDDRGRVPALAGGLPGREALGTHRPRPGRRRRDVAAGPRRPDALRARSLRRRGEPAPRCGGQRRGPDHGAPERPRSAGRGSRPGPQQPRCPRGHQDRRRAGRAGSGGAAAAGPRQRGHRAVGRRIPAEPAVRRPRSATWPTG